EGLVEELSVRENIILALQARRGWARPLARRQQEEIAAKYIKALDIRPADPETAIRNLSGGNQQKVLLARWLITEPRLLILDEPTRGIDIGAKADIQRLVVDLAGDGLAVLFISAELDEVLRLSHKVVVLRDRVVVAQVENSADVDADLIMTTIATGAGQ
ncbi:MAG: ATP-binding cassette domain-containing protein, partial [Actinoplanes sp.]